MPKAALNIQNQSDHSASHRPETRKLDLVKCNRCRLDKKKCTPTARTWPTKCNRCLKKGFPCSTGRRVERKSKHTPDYSEPFSNKSDFEEHLDTWVYLRGYYEIVSKGLERLSRLREAMIQPFIESWCPNHSFDEEMILTEEYMSGISEYLEESIEKTRKALVSDSSASYNNHTNVVTLLASQTLLPKSPLELCPFCDDMGKRKEFLNDLQDRNLLCAELQAQQFYLAKVLRSKCRLLNRDEELAAEMDRSDVLWSLIIDRSMSIKCEYFNGIVRLSNSATFVPDEVVFFRLSAGWSESEDLLKRTNAHQWLDALPFVPHRDQFLDRLKSYLEEAKNLEHKDVLGRTLLHIACIKNWEAGVKMLLKYGANPGAHTIHGSLPLHYAAANGSAILCGLLLERKEYFDVDKLDKAGLKARDYALHNGNTVIIEMLQRSVSKEMLPSIMTATQAPNASEEASTQTPQPYFSVPFSKATHVRHVRHAQQHNHNVLSATGSSTSLPSIEKTIAGPDAAGFLTRLHPSSSERIYSKEQPSLPTSLSHINRWGIPMIPAPFPGSRDFVHFEQCPRALQYSAFKDGQFTLNWHDKLFGCDMWSGFDIWLGSDNWWCALLDNDNWLVF